MLSKTALIASLALVTAHTALAETEPSYDRIFGFACVDKDAADQVWETTNNESDPEAIQSVLAQYAENGVCIETPHWFVVEPSVDKIDSFTRSESIQDGNKITLSVTNFFYSGVRPFGYPSVDQFYVIGQVTGVFRMQVRPAPNTGLDMEPI